MDELSASGGIPLVEAEEYSLVTTVSFRNNMERVASVVYAAETNGITINDHDGRYVHFFGTEIPTLLSAIEKAAGFVPTL